MICARPLNRLRDHGCGCRLADDFHVHLRIHAAGAAVVFHAHGDDVVAGMQRILDVEHRLRRPVVRFADELAVDVNPAVVVNRGEMNLRAGIVEVFLRQLDVRAVNRRGFSFQSACRRSLTALQDESSKSGANSGAAWARRPVENSACFQRQFFTAM